MSGLIVRYMQGSFRELPEDLAALDVLLRDPRLLQPIASGWSGGAVSHGRPTIPMEVYVRLMVVKQRTGWGYETLVREVSNSLHLRRFCLIALGERVPHESTVRKLTSRLGGEVVDELTRCVIAKARRETRFVARAVRIDSTAALCGTAAAPISTARGSHLPRPRGRGRGRSLRSPAARSPCCATTTARVCRSTPGETSPSRSRPPCAAGLHTARAPRRWRPSPCG